MIFLWITFSVVLFLIILTVIISYYCYKKAFHAGKRIAVTPEEYSLPPGKIYEPFHDTMITWTKETRIMPHKEFSIKSFDGLTLRGKYYECDPEAPIELMFHGYRGSAERDLCGGIQRCFTLGRNVLLVDQRASGKSDGRVITFGINERKDCLRWIDFMIEHFGEDVKIILTGISMGAATVMMATEYDLPHNVVGVLADCGYTSPKEIIMKVISEMGLPPKLAYPFVKTGARLFGHFNVDESSPIKAMESCNVPVIFIHGEADDYVPCDMSRRNFEACKAPKKLVTIPQAGHGLSYLVDPERYLNVLIEFAPVYGIPVADSNKFR